MSDAHSVAELSELLDVTEGTVRRWIKAGLLQANKIGRAYTIPFDLNSEFVVKKIREKPRHDLPYVAPVISQYDRWHTVLDEICWLLKVTYSDKAKLKKRDFRIDQLFASYLRQNLSSLASVKKALYSGKAGNVRPVVDDLKRGWYNELAFAFPLKSSTLGLAFRDLETNQEDADFRFVFPSWRIVTAYYAIYFYVRSISLQKEPDLRRERHDASISTFKFNVVPRLRDCLWKFPFDISWAPAARVRRNTLPVISIHHMRYEYARHPRAPHRSPPDCFEFVRRHFRNRGRARATPTMYTLIDFLREFRIWANYIDIDNLISLRGSGYRGFLDQNMSTMMFFIAGISELSYIATYGEKSYFEKIQNFYDVFALNNPVVEKGFSATPLYQRTVLFRALGLVKGKVMLSEPVDVNAVSVKP